MKRFFLVLTACLLCTGTFAQEWESLFNGKSFNMHSSRNEFGTFEYGSHPVHDVVPGFLDIDRYRVLKWYHTVPVHI